MNNQQEFQNVLKNVLVEFHVKNMDLAAHLHTSQQYVSKFLNGYNIPNKLTFQRILQYLEIRGVPELERWNLSCVYVAERTGFRLERRSESGEWTARDEWERKFLADFRLLSPEGRQELLRQMGDMLAARLQAESQEPSGAE